MIIDINNTWNRNQRLAPMLEVIASEEFKKIVNGIGGYDTSQTSNTTFVG